MGDADVDRDLARQRVRSGLGRWFLTPPRAHGEVRYDREVSFLELFYDLVYVVVIGRASHHLAEHVDAAGVRDFAIVFGVIWLAWFNGTFWHELHGRGDGQSRLYLFTQMGLIALLAVFTGDAGGEDGASFAVVAAILFLLFTWQWYLVHRIDVDPRYRPTTIGYLIGMAVTVTALAISAFVGDAARLAIWAVLVVGWAVGGFVLVSRDRTEGFGRGVTASLVERFGLFNIIVLGEVVIGVVDGIGDAEERGATTIAVGMLGLGIGMGLWWNYFDLLGRRIPERRGPRLAGWMFGHLPTTAAVAAAGAAMVSLVEHAADDRTPVGTARLLSGSVVIVLGGVALAVRALPDDTFPGRLIRQVAPTFGAAAALIVVVALLRPAPLVLVATIALVLTASWFWLFTRLLAHGGLAGGPEEAVAVAPEA